MAEDVRKLGNCCGTCSGLSVPVTLRSLSTHTVCVDEGSGKAWTDGEGGVMCCMCGAPRRTGSPEDMSFLVFFCPLRRGSEGPVLVQAVVFWVF